MEPKDDKISVVLTSPATAAEGGKGKRLGRMATIEDDDERLLAQIGYTQVGCSSS